MLTVKLLKIKVLIRTHKFINNYKTPAYHHRTSHKHKTRQKTPQSTKLTNLPNFPVIQFHCHFNTKKRMSDCPCSCGKYHQYFNTSLY